MISLFTVNVPPRDELMPELERVLYSGYIAQGPQVTRFEEALRPVLGNTNVVTVNSGTAALQLALRLAGARNHTVVTTPMTCSATALPVLAEGSIPVWADINPATGNLDPQSVAEVIRPDTAAILTLHWGGQPGELKGLRDIADARGIPLIIDAAHALGSEYAGKPTGSNYADFTCFSLQAIKHITTGDGGILTTRRDSDYGRARNLRWFGLNRDEATFDTRVSSDIAEWGYKFHMNDINATIGLASLPYLAETVDVHRANAAFYDDVFAGTGLKRQMVPAEAEGSWWLYTLLFPAAEQRMLFQDFMRERGVQAGRVHGRVDKLTCFLPYSSTKPLPGVTSFFSKQCCIPVHAGLTRNERDQVANAVLDFMKECS